MLRLIKSLLFYPLVFVAGLFSAVLRTLGWLCLVGGFLFGGFWLAGELIISGWTIVSVGVAGVIALTAAELLTALLVCLFTPGSDRQLRANVR